MDDAEIRTAYKYGRANGLDDKHAADFVDWVIQHEGEDLTLNVALQAWRDEMDNFSLWQNELQDQGMAEWEGLVWMGLILFVFYLICQVVRAIIAV